MIASGTALTEGPVASTLVKKAVPMLFGILAILLFNIVDTFYVGQLGKLPLAAMSFTFPVTFVVLSLSMGVGIGTTAVISNAIGHGDEARVRRLTTDAVILAITLVVGLAGLGLFSQRHIFQLLGAPTDLIPLILQYMTPWWFGVGLLVMPMVGNSAIRATGDMKTPSYIMVFSGIVNLVLDPMLIFGLGPFPRLELMGAAIATIVSWFVTFVAAFWVLAFREKMLAFRFCSWSEVLASWRAVLWVGGPAATTNMLIPIAGAVLTRLVSGHGAAAVAAWGVGNRLEGLSMVGIAALSTALTPFVGQNMGAGRCDRLREAVRFVIFASLVWGAGAAVVLGILAYPIAHSFNNDPEVVSWIVKYLWLVPFSYTGLGTVQLIGTFYNGAQRPLHSAALSGLRLLVFGVPLASVGMYLDGLQGMFLGIALGNVLVGGASVWMVRGLIDRHEASLSPPHQVPVTA